MYDCDELVYNAWSVTEAAEAAIQPTWWHVIIVIIISVVALMRENP